MNLEIPAGTKCRVRCHRPATSEVWFAYSGALFNLEKAQAEAKATMAQWPDVVCEVVPEETWMEWQLLAKALIERIGRIDDTTPGTPDMIEPQWWLRMMEVRRLLGSEN